VTISVEERAAAMRRVLVRLSEEFWDNPRGFFGNVDLANAAPLATTVAEMEGKGLCRLAMFLSNPRPYELTCSGWFEAQRIAGRFETADFNERRARLCAALKGAVKGRSNDAVLTISELAQLASVPEGWVLNVLEAQTLDNLSPQHGYGLQVLDRGAVIVPTTFGQIEVTLD
jgi:hypothetical protein